MNPLMLSEIAKEGLYLVLFLSAPLLSMILGASVVVGLLSQYTKLSEPAVGHVARILAGLGGLILVSPWMATHMVRFAGRTWQLLQIMVS